MHEQLGSFIQNTSQKFHKNFINLKTPIFFSKTPNLDRNGWKMRDKEIIPSNLRQEKAKNHVDWRFWERGVCLGGEKAEINWERLRRNEEKLRRSLI